MDCPSADGHQFTRHVSLLSVTTTETIYKQLKKNVYICYNIKVYYIKKNQTNKIIDIICCGFFFPFVLNVFNFTAHLNSSRPAHAWLNIDSHHRQCAAIDIKRFEIFMKTKDKKKPIHKLARMTSDVLERDAVREKILI